jgi:ribosomal protein S18 acetylase RimI-like enzyme
MLQIRQAAALDSDAIWEIFQPIVARGDTYALDPRISREDGLAYWLHPANSCYVAEHQGNVVGTYILRSNQSGPGSHVANAAFMVSLGARGLGVGRKMGEHALSEAGRLGFRAVQFNFVVSTNEPAVRLWQKLGFEIVGTLPGVFRHPEKGLVDAYVMFRSLAQEKA